MEDKAFGDDDAGKNKDDVDGGYTPYDPGSGSNIAGDDDYDPYADQNTNPEWDDSSDDWDNPNNDSWDNDDNWNSLIRLFAPKDEFDETQKALNPPPEYLSAEEMNWAYMLLFFIEGFGSQTIGFSSSYYATACGEIGWSMFESMLDDTIPSLPDEEYELFIDSTTF